MRILVICLGLVTAWDAWGRIERPPPFPPLGWEAEITEGFDPLIEATLVDDYEAGIGRRWAHVQAWGPAAAPVLQRLHATPEWKEYRWSIRWYLELLEEPVPLEPLDERLREALVELVEDGARELFGTYHSACSQEYARQAERLAENVAVIRDAARQDSSRTAEIITGKFVALDETKQQVLVQALSKTGTPEGVALLEQLADANESQQLRSRIDYALRQARDAARVFEPIAEILEREEAP